jgi:hypothetical protein
MTRRGLLEAVASSNVRSQAALVASEHSIAAVPHFFVGPLFSPFRSGSMFSLTGKERWLSIPGITERLNVAVVGTANELDLDDAGAYGRPHPTADPIG